MIGDGRTAVDVGRQCRREPVAEAGPSGMRDESSSPSLWRNVKPYPMFPVKARVKPVLEGGLEQVFVGVDADPVTENRRTP